MNLSKKQIVLASPFLIITINFGVAYLFGNIIGKWAFIPIILIERCLFLFFILNYTEKQQEKGQSGWNILALVVVILPLPLFLLHYDTLAIRQVWLP